MTLNPGSVVIIYLLDSIMEDQLAEAQSLKAATISSTDAAGKLCSEHLPLQVFASA